MFERALELARKYANSDQRAYALSAMGMALARLGRFTEAQAAEQAALEIVHATVSPVTESDVELFAGWAYLDIGDAPAGLAHGQRGVELAIATDNFDCICGALACVGFGHMQARQLPEAAEAFEQAIEQTKLSGAMQFEVMARGGLAVTPMAGGQPEALAELERAMARAHDLHDTFTEARFSHVAAQAHLAQGDLAGAQAFLNTAVAYFQRTAMGHYLAQALATQAELNEKLAANS